MSFSAMCIYLILLQCTGVEFNRLHVHSFHLLGSEEDEWRLRELLTQIGYEVHVYRDMKKFVSIKSFKMNWIRIPFYEQHA